MTGPRGRPPHPGEGGLARPTFQRKFAEADSESEMSSSDEGTGSAHTGNLNNARSLSMNNATPCKVAAFVVMASPLFTRAKAKGFFWPESRQRPIWWHRNDNCFVFEDGSSVHVVSWIFLVFSHAESRCSSLQSSPPVFSILADGSHTEGWTGHPAGGVLC